MAYSYQKCTSQLRHGLRRSSKLSLKRNRYHNRDQIIRDLVRYSSGSQTFLAHGPQAEFFLGGLSWMIFGETPPFLLRIFGEDPHFPEGSSKNPHSSAPLPCSSCESLILACPATKSSSSGKIEYPNEYRPTSASISHDRSKFRWFRF